MDWLPYCNGNQFTYHVDLFSIRVDVGGGTTELLQDFGFLLVISDAGQSLVVLEGPGTMDGGFVDSVVNNFVGGVIADIPHRRNAAGALVISHTDRGTGDGVDHLAGPVLARLGGAETRFSSFGEAQNFDGAETSVVNINLVLVVKAQETIRNSVAGEFLQGVAGVNDAVFAFLGGNGEGQGHPGVLVGSDISVGLAGGRAVAIGHGRVGAEHGGIRINHGLGDEGILELLGELVALADEVTNAQPFIVIGEIGENRVIIINAGRAGRDDEITDDGVRDGLVGVRHIGGLVDLLDGVDRLEALDGGLVVIDYVAGERAADNDRQQSGKELFHC